MRRDWVGVRTDSGRRIHWYEGESFDGAMWTFTACGMWAMIAVDRDHGEFGPTLDDYCARCDAAVLRESNA